VKALTGNGSAELRETPKSSLLYLPHGQLRQEVAIERKGIGLQRWRLDQVLSRGEHGQGGRSKAKAGMYPKNPKQFKNLITLENLIFVQRKITRSKEARNEEWRILSHLSIRPCLRERVGN
jgi:hypothetical protein